MENIKRFNKRLKEQYGTALDGSPLFRIVWSEDLTEKRFFAEYHKHSPGGLWLGVEFNVVKEEKKYDYIRDRYIFEVYDPSQRVNNDIRGGDNYEPLFVFDKGGKYLKPEWFAIEYIVKRFRAALAGETEKRTEKMDALADQEALDKETAKFMDYLSNESSDMMNKFRYQEAVLIHRGDE